MVDHAVVSIPETLAPETLTKIRQGRYSQPFRDGMWFQCSQGGRRIVLRSREGVTLAEYTPGGKLKNGNGR